MKTNVKVISTHKEVATLCLFHFTYSNSGLLVSSLYPSTAYDDPMNHGLE